MVAVQIKYHGMDPSDSLSAAVEEHAQKLSRFCDRIMHCNVFIGASQHRHRHGNHYHVHADLVLRGGELVMGHTPAKRVLDEDPYRAVSHTFGVLERRLVEAEAQLRDHRAI